MKHIGIITEYNPFHNGHYYQLQLLKKNFPEKKLVIIMSGDFVQRGEPAIFNKYLRTKCALSGGADLIFELPSLFATASAEHFASAAVLALASTGIIDTLCFGAEHDHLSAFHNIAKLLLEEPLDYQVLLKKYLKTGLSFPKARAVSVAEYLQDNLYETILREPNNILGIEYIKAIHRYHLDLTPFIIKRTGNGYHDTALNTNLCSATALRKLIGNTLSSDNPLDSPFEIANLSYYMPARCYHVLTESEYFKPLFSSDFYSFLQYALWQNKNKYTDFFEVTTEMSNSLSELLQYPETPEYLLQLLSCKNYTASRIRRALLNIMLNHTKNDFQSAKNNGYISYLRILGFQKNSSFLLKEMKSKCNLPVINKVADAKKILHPSSYSYFEKELQTSMLYKQAFFNRYGFCIPSEYEQSVIIQTN